MIEDVVDCDPATACIRDLVMGRDKTWTGTASELLRALEIIRTATGEGASARWPRGSRALAGRLRRAQPFLRSLGIETTFSREGRLGIRTIQLTARDLDQQTSPETRHPAVVRLC